MNATSARTDVRATRLTGCVVLVTGGARGQGASHAHRLAGEGATVWACDVLDDDGAALGSRLEAEGLEVLFDDRPKVSPGVKFGDAELLGVPTVLVVGRGLKDGVLELKDRASGSSEDVPRDGVAAVVAAAVRG